MQDNLWIANVFFLLLTFPWGLYCVINPRSVFRLNVQRHGFEDEEPGGADILVIRLKGVALFLLGIGLVLWFTFVEAPTLAS